MDKTGEEINVDSIEIVTYPVKTSEEIKTIVLGFVEKLIELWKLRTKISQAWQKY